MRLFIAALLPHNICEQLTNHIRSLRADVEGVKWEKPEKLHITLKFLGDVEKSRFDEISDSIRHLVQRTSAFKVNLSEFGGFPSLKNPRILHVGLSFNSELSKFHRELDSSLSELGFEKEERKFIPHITIGRVKKKISIKDRPVIAETTFKITQIAIIKSELRSMGPVYIPLKLFDLEK